MWSILVATLLTATTALPTGRPLTKDLPSLEDVQREIQAVSYITNFQNMMADYVKSQYKNLTVNEMQSVRDTLEQFLRELAGDLHRVIVDKQFEENQSIDDGIPDTTFDEIKKSVRQELTDINEEAVDQIIYKLRKNLHNTRKKLDKIIEDSKIAAIINS